MILGMSLEPFIELRLWDDQDLPALAAIAAAIHEGGALAGIELCHNGLNAPNLYSRETPLGPHHLPVATYGYDPVQARMMTKRDIADLRRWHRNAVLRDAGRLRPAVGELPDLWDFVLGSWEADSATSRFGPEGEQEQYVAGLKQLTSKPVVGVGRFTSPDLMVRQVKDGILDFIGAARPSIADPFLPEKIRTGRLETIRECIGCNVCVSGTSRCRRSGGGRPAPGWWCTTTTTATWAACSPNCCRARASRSRSSRRPRRCRRGRSTRWRSTGSSAGCCWPGLRCAPARR
jgi:2,4-dienoyl-CoA reductase-like NADH-dependent reductase (Old Yellow Enzyme family)